MPTAARAAVRSAVPYSSATPSSTRTSTLRRVRWSLPSRACSFASTITSWVSLRNTLNGDRTPHTSQGEEEVPFRMPHQAAPAQVVKGKNQPDHPSHATRFLMPSPYPRREAARSDQPTERRRSPRTDSGGRGVVIGSAWRWQSFQVLSSDGRRWSPGGRCRPVRLSPIFDRRCSTSTT